MKTDRIYMVLLTLSILLVSSTIHAADSNEAVVTSVTLPMHAEMARDSAVLRILQGGDIVSIDYELEGSDGTWCFITLKETTVMGYVPCDNLTRKAKENLWDRLLDKADDKTNNKTAERRSVNNSDVRVLLYMTEW